MPSDTPRIPWSAARAAAGRRTRYVTTAAAALCLACGAPPADGTEAIAVRDSAGVTIVDQDLTRLTSVCTLDPEPVVSIGVEEGAPEYMLAQLFGAVRLSDGRIVLAQRTTNDIRYFAPDGTFIRSSGRKGRGPGEFESPFYLNVLPGDTLYVGDYRPWQFLVFGPEGDWVRTVRPMPLVINVPSPAIVLANGQLILGKASRDDAPPETFPREYVDLIRYAPTGELLDTLGRYPNGRYGQVKPAPDATFIFPYFESFGLFAGRGERVVIGHASATELSVHRADSAFTLERILRWNDGPREITEADLAADRERTRERYSTMSRDQAERLMEPMISKDRPVAEQFPAFGQLQIGTDDRLWIREYPRPRDTTEYRWVAFKPDGAFDCRLQTPRYAQFYEFGRDYMLVRDADSLGVERVQQYHLRSP